MSKSKNNKKIKRNKTAKHKRSKKRIHKHINKHKHREILLASRTPEEIYKISKNISKKIDLGSYSPTINKELITLRSIPRKELLDCNIEKAYKLKEPLKIGIKGKIYGKSCYNYNTPQAKQFLLKNLAADKHIEINIPKD
jgi:hypothetical protein